MGSEKLDEYASVGRTVVRQGIKVGGKRGGRAAQGALASGKTAVKHVSANKPGKGEAIGSVVGSLAGGIGGGIAGTPLGGVGAIATGVAGGQVGEKIGGAIGKKFDNKKLPPVKKESFSDWRNDLTVDEAKVDAGKSPETKEKDRNVRKFGVSHNVAGHGKLRRSLHRMNRGDKKIRGDKSAWTEMESVQLGEEGYDRMRDDRLVKYGIGHDGSDRRGSTSRPTGKQPKGKTVLQKETEKKYGKGVSALDVVKAKIEKEHGKGAIAK